MNLKRSELLKRQLFEHPREISIERARLYTKSHAKTQGLAQIIRRARATEYILDHVEISIREHEILFANRTVKPRSGIISPEMSPYWILEEVDTIHKRPQDKFIFREEDKKFFTEKLYPYWKNNSLKDFIKGELDEELLEPQRKKIYKINQTDKGQGHIIPDYEKVLSKGLDALISETKSKCEEHPNNDFYSAALIVQEAIRRHIYRYIEVAQDEIEKTTELRRKNELIKAVDVSKRVAGEAPETFYEALQLLWYVCVALQYESNASSISLGQFDKYMYRYYESDIKKGVKKEYLQELLESFWIKTNDVVLVRSEESAKYFAGFPTGYTMTLGGLLENGHSAVNELSHLCLDAYKNIKLPQPNIGVRINERTPRDFMINTVETIRLGTGIPQIFNDEVIIPSFLNRGVNLEDARDYSVVGCVELSIPGKTYGLHDIALFNMLKVMELSLYELEDKKDITFEYIIDHIKSNINKYVKSMTEASNIVDVCHGKYAPVPFLSSITNSCIERGEDITAGGAKYNYSGVQGIGTANLSDSLYAIKKLVFEEKIISFSGLINVLKSNYEGTYAKQLREKIINEYDKFGNDNDEVDMIGSDILRYYSKEVEKYSTPRGGIFVPGSYTVSAHIPLGTAVGATPDGRMSGDQLADGGLSPMVGRDKLGPTAVLKSVSKLDSYLLSNGSLLNVKISPDVIAETEGLQRFANLLYSFMKLKIQHVQFNILSADTLRKAQDNPEKYSNLVVRVAGYSAFFNDLSVAIQDDIICRTEHRL